MSATPEFDPASHHLRQVDAGWVQGFCQDGICRFLGVPYAAPPVGTNRFREPQPVAPWDGVRDATRPGPSSWQELKPFPAIDVVPLIGDGYERGDNYLTLNVWTPGGGERRPVMVFIHGGGFLVGSKDAPINDGSSFARSAISTAQIKVIDVWDVRRTIEVRTAMLAATNASAAQAQKIVDLAERLEAEDHADEQTTETDIAFHVAIAEASGNELFHQIVISFVPLMKVSIPQAWRTRQTVDQRRTSVDRHRKLAEAIARRDVDGARKWMSEHFDESVGVMLGSS